MSNLLLKTTRIDFPWIIYEGESCLPYLFLGEEQFPPDEESQDREITNRLIKPNYEIPLEETKNCYIGFAVRASRALQAAGDSKAYRIIMREYYSLSKKWDTKYFMQLIQKAMEDERTYRPGENGESRAQIYLRKAMSYYLNIAGIEDMDFWTSQLIKISNQDLEEDAKKVRGSEVKIRQQFCFDDPIFKLFAYGRFFLLWEECLKVGIVRADEEQKVKRELEILRNIAQRELNILGEPA